MNKPFSQQYVLNETLKHISKSIGISTQKTIARLPEFINEPEMTKEVMSTLASLNQLSKLIDSIRQNNLTILGETQ